MISDIMAVTYPMLLLAVALASTTASARSCVVRCPGQPASCSTCTSSGPLWAPSLTIFSDGVPEDFHQGVLEGSLGDLLEQSEREKVA